MKEESISLFFKDSRSDKEYHAQLKARDDGWVVTFQYGRRGGTLKSGAKIESPVAYEVAKAEYDELVKSKKAKQYREAKTAVDFLAAVASEPTGILPQLLNAIDEGVASSLLRDPMWCAQEKYDGHRRLVQMTPAVLGINRKGQPTGLPAVVAEDLEALQGCAPLVVDGELVGDMYFAFDILEWKGQDTKTLPLEERLAFLEAARALMADAGATNIVVAETALTTEAKLALYANMRSGGREGVVFKLLQSVYEAGRPSSGGNQLKRKFTHHASVLVFKQNVAKRSVGMAVYDEAGKTIDVGNVTIPPNHPVPAVGAIVDVEYLYAYPGGSLIQPVFHSLRDDLDPDACTLAQLSMKALDAPADVEVEEQ